MHDSLSDSSVAEHDLSLFLNALEVELPATDPKHPDEYVIIPLNPRVASWLDTKDGKAVLLAYRYAGIVYPVSIFFLGGDEGSLFCHSTLLLDAYAGDEYIVSRLRGITQEFFSRDADELMGTLEPLWTDATLKGQMDCRILWNMKPTLKIAVDLFLTAFGEVPDIPLFPTVYSYNNPYLENLLEVVVPELKTCDRVLVLGTGAGLEAACIALKHEICVDATDINPLAIANTLVTARRVGVDHLVHAWVSDGLENVRGKYDAILFTAPLPMEEVCPKDRNRYDFCGILLREVLAALPAHLSPNGRMYLMSRPDLSPYGSMDRLRSKARRYFTAKSSVAIHEIWLEDVPGSHISRPLRRLTNVAHADDLNF
jgi:methyltransferase family protein